MLAMLKTAMVVHTVMHVFCFPSPVFEWEGHACVGPLQIEDRVLV